MPRSLALVALLALLWGASYPILKVAVQTVPPLTVAGVRGLLGGLLLVALLGRRVNLLWTSGIPFRTYVVQGMFTCILPWILVTWASTSLDASLVTILSSLSPLFVFLITWAITRHEPANARKFVGVVLGMAGVLTIVGPGSLAGAGRNALAEIACVAGSLSYAMALIVGRRFDRVTPLVPATGSTLVGAAVLLPLALGVERPWTTQPSAASMAAVLALAVFSTVAAFLVYFRLLQMAGSIATSSQAYLRILVGVGLGVALLGERLSAVEVAGMVLVVFGVVAMTLAPRRVQPEA